jgi:hypothetical protein
MTTIDPGNRSMSAHPHKGKHDMSDDRKETLILMLLDHLRGIDAALNQPVTYPADITLARQYAATALRIAATERAA